VRRVAAATKLTYIDASSLRLIAQDKDCLGARESRIPRRRPQWQCIGGPEEWIGTELTFRLKPKDDQIVVLFSHAGWREPVEFMHHCSTKWAVFLLSLKDWIERAEGRPHPYDIKIHPGD